MHPVLLRIGPLTLHTYGFFVAVGFLLGLLWCSREARRRGFDPEIIPDLFFYVVLSALLGARLLYILLNLSYFLATPLAVFKIWEGGLVFYGGFLAAMPVLYWRIRYWRQSPLEIFDIAAPGLVLAQSVGRLGCLSAGCCFGRRCDLPIAVIFTDPLSHAPLNVPLYPTQIFHALADAVIFFLLVVINRRSHKVGYVAFSYLVLYGIGRFVIEFWRGDPRGFYAGLSTSQWISLVLLAGAILLWFLRLNRSDS